MSDTPLLSLALKAHKAKISNDYRSFNRLSKQIESLADQRISVFAKKYKDSEAFFFNNLGRGRFE